jgi:hypothetical protein
MIMKPRKFKVNPHGLENKKSAGMDRDHWEEAMGILASILRIASQ